MRPGEWLPVTFEYRKENNGRGPFYTPHDLFKRYPAHQVYPKKETVNHPSHYKHPSGIECIDVVEHMGFNLGNVIKYVWRADSKGNTLEDLKKAEFYIKREIEKRSK